MNSVGKISLGFEGDNQHFFQNLYGGLDSFLFSAIEKPTGEVLFIYNKDTEHVEMGTLELDLGTFSEDGFYIHFATAYREKLTEALVLCIANPVLYGVRKITKQKQLSEILFHFLRFGSLQWDVDKKYKDINYLFLEVAKHEESALKKFLLSYGHYTSLQRRLVYQLEDVALEEGIRLITASERSFVLSYLHFLQAKYKVAAESSGISRQDHRNVVWEIIYAYLLNNKSSFFSTKFFLKYTITALAARYNFDYKELLKIITYELEKGYGNEVVKPELYMILDELKREMPAKPAVRSIIRMARMYIAAVSAQRESTEWKSNKKILEDILKKQDTCRSFLQHLAEVEIIALVRVIIPQEYSFVTGYTRILEVQKERGLLQGKAGGEFRLLKWQIIFPLLLDDSGFNRKYFVLHTLRKIASHYNLHVNELLTYIIASAKVLPERITAVLSQLYKELPGYSILNEYASPSNPDEVIIQAYIRTGKELNTEEMRHWKTVFANTSFREKILGQLKSETQHTGLISLLFPLHADSIIAYAAGLDLYNKKALLQGKTAGSFVQVKWKFIHAVLFEPQHNIFNTKYFVERVLFRISAHYNLKMEELLEFFYTEADVGNTIPLGLISALRELYYDKIKIRKNIQAKEKQTENILNVQYAAERLYRYFGKDKALSFLIRSLSKEHEFVNFIDEVLQVELLIRNYLINELNIIFDRKAVLKLLLRFSAEHGSLTRSIVMGRILLYYTGLATDNRKALLLEHKLRELSRTTILVQEAISNLAKINKNKINTGTMDKNVEKEEIRAKDKAVADYINNAGLVLLHPYLPRLFAMLSLTEDGRFTGEEAQFRAIFLMQYAVFGLDEFPEHEMQLNKLLAGVGQKAAVPYTVAITENEKETVDSLLNAVISAWSKLGTTSADGLRGTFLVRDGRLSEQDDFYQLVVEEKAFDILLGSLPWSISTIKYSWMEKGINIKWR